MRACFSRAIGRNASVAFRFRERVAPAGGVFDRTFVLGAAFLIPFTRSLEGGASGLLPPMGAEVVAFLMVLVFKPLGLASVEVGFTVGVAAGLGWRLLESLDPCAF